MLNLSNWRGQSRNLTRSPRKSVKKLLSSLTNSCKKKEERVEMIAMRGRILLFSLPWSMISSRVLSIQRQFIQHLDSRLQRNNYCRKIIKNLPSALIEYPRWIHSEKQIFLKQRQLKTQECPIYMMCHSMISSPVKFSSKACLRTSIKKWYWIIN